MTLFNDPGLAKRAWIDAFLAHVMKEAPATFAPRIAGAAEELFAKYSFYDPVDVAEAAWDLLPLPPH